MAHHRLKVYVAEGQFAEVVGPTAEKLDDRVERAVRAVTPGHERNGH